MERNFLSAQEKEDAIKEIKAKNCTQSEIAANFNVFQMPLFQD